MNVLLTGIFLLFVGIMGIMPFFVIYRFSDGLRFILSDVIKYRRKVIYSNLRKAFPGKSETEINSLVRKTYMNLMDNILEGIKTFTLRKSQLIKRYRINNPELITPLIEANKSIIAVTGHYNNWEWGSLAASLQIKANFAALYKPLSNKYIDKMIYNSRSKCGTELVSIYETNKTFEKYKDRPTVYLLAADQSPAKGQLDKSYWYDFMGIKTAFLYGLEKYAVNNNYPTVYIDIQRVKRGFYEVELSLLSDKPSQLKDGELTERYVRKLESVIKKQPENWLWSHRRWKHSPN
ncbi:MAG: lysophospholipid acyltransferase family protein [Bacteroidales bacterium]|nr:lysophospholipid acyltransferase family protein [Bacteroidales bacterium]